MRGKVTLLCIYTLKLLLLDVEKKKNWNATRGGNNG